MADRYRVGGTGTRDASTTTHWSASSGGAGGASVPTVDDNVIVDLHSNEPSDAAFTLTIASEALACKNLNISYGITNGVTLFNGEGSDLLGSLVVNGDVTFADGQVDATVFAFSVSGITNIDTYETPIGFIELQNATATLLSNINTTLLMYGNGSLDLNGFYYYGGGFGFFNLLLLQQSEGHYDLYLGTGAVIIDRYDLFIVDYGMFWAFTYEDTGVGITLKPNTGGIVLNIAGYCASQYNIHLVASQGPGVFLFIVSVEILEIYNSGFMFITEADPIIPIDINVGNIVITGTGFLTSEIPYITLVKNNGTIEVDNITLQNIKSNGFVAGRNSTDLGGNDGWIFKKAPGINSTADRTRQMTGRTEARIKIYPDTLNGCEYVCDGPHGALLTDPVRHIKKKILTGTIPTEETETGYGFAVTDLGTVQSYTYL